MTKETTPETVAPADDFFVPERYDESLITKGVWYESIDHNDTLWGKFKVRWFDQETPEIKAAAEKVRAKYAKFRENKKPSVDDVIFEVFINAALVDWEVKDSKGEPKAFTPENVRAYFAIPKVKNFVYPALREFSFDVANYGEAPKDLVLGN